MIPLASQVAIANRRVAPGGRHGEVEQLATRPPPRQDHHRKDRGAGPTAPAGTTVAVGISSSGLPSPNVGNVELACQCSSGIDAAGLERVRAARELGDQLQCNEQLEEQFPGRAY